MRTALRTLLKLLGKGERKVAAVFGFEAATSHRAVLHVREGAAEIPIWLYSTMQPLPETASLCERVEVRSSSLALAMIAEWQLWSCWVALSVGAWTGGHGHWPMKLAPLLVPPFRALLVNRRGDFFDGTLRNVMVHWSRLVRDAITSGWYRMCDFGRGVWYSGPVTRTKHVTRGVLHKCGALRYSGPVTRVKDLSRALWNWGPVTRTKHITQGVLHKCGALRYSGPVTRLKDVSRGLRHWGPVTRMKDISRGAWHCPPVTRVKDVSRGAWHSPPSTRAKDLLKGVLLLVNAAALRWTATALRWCSYPDRRLFHRLHGAQALDVAVAGCEGGGVDRYAHGALRWDGRRFEKFVQQSKARWILWQEQGSADLLEDMLPLLEDERTFAVSRQSHFRAWHPMLLPTAPFRKLEPGEASQVLAPISPSILVDRQKLLALGIPHSILSQTAWLLIFWKAAAAGWRSFSVGHQGNVTLRRDWPMQERAFILDVLLNPALRRLGPHEADLARGNIAFQSATGGSRADEGVRPTKVLVLSPFLPYPLSHGGAVRIYNLCRALSDRVDFILAAVREKQDVVDYGKLHEIFREVYIVDMDEAASNGNLLPMQVRERQSRSLQALIANICRTSKPDLLQVEYTHMAAFRGSAPDVPAVLVEHDITFSLYRQLVQTNPGAAVGDEYMRWLEFEKQWLANYDGVWTVSEEDCQMAIREGKRPAGRTFNIPNGVDIDRFVPGGEPGGGLEILYVGSFRHLPNVIGFEKLCREVMPLVWCEFPEVRLRVVAGPGHWSFWHKFGRNGLPQRRDPRVEIHAFVEDLRPLYARAAAVVVPLEVSAGTNIKVLEAMACGKAIVSTPVGCAGLGLQDRGDILIRKEWGDFARAVCDILSDSALRGRLGRQARRTAVENFSWTAIADRALQSYRVPMPQGSQGSRGSQ